MRDINEIEVNGNLLVDIIAAHAKWAENRNTGARADLRSANLSYANLSGANLSRANLYNANLRGANLFGANLSGVNLSGANLSRANLRRANLGGVNLSGANLCGVDLNSVDLSCADLYDADGIMSFGPVGSSGRIGYAVIFDGTTMFALGCYWGNFDDTCKAIVKKYGENSLYEKQVRLADEILREKMQDIARVAPEMGK